MATFPEGNPGEYPLNIESPVGHFRTVYGDIYSEPYDPVVPDIQNYKELSDGEIEGFLAQSSGGSVPRAIGLYVLSLSSRAALEAKAVKDYDLQIDTTKRAADLRASAQLWFDRADADDIAEGFGDIFEIYGPEGCFTPEGSPAMLGRRYIWDQEGC